MTFFHDPKDDLIEELRADKARLIKENEALQATLLALTDAKAYSLRHRGELMGRPGSPSPSGQATAVPGWSNAPSDFRNSRPFEPPVSYEEIEASFTKARDRDLAGLANE